MAPTCSVDRFGTTHEGAVVERFVLAADAGVSMTVITYGAIITSIRTPDRHGRAGDVALGYDNLEGYLRDRSYLGAVVGRHHQVASWVRTALGGGRPGCLPASVR